MSGPTSKIYIKIQMYLNVNSVNNVNRMNLRKITNKPIGEITMIDCIEQPLSKLSVRKDLRITVKRIAADRNEFIYDLTEKVFEDAFPEYFPNHEMKH